MQPMHNVQPMHNSVSMTGYGPLRAIDSRGQQSQLIQSFEKPPAYRATDGPFVMPTGRPDSNYGGLPPPPTASFHRSQLAEHADVREIM